MNCRQPVQHALSDQRAHGNGVGDLPRRSQRGFFVFKNGQTLLLGIDAH